MPMTLDEMMSAIGKAENAGDKEAADWMRSQAQAQLTGKAGIAANLGAGASNFIEGGKQLIGLGMGDEALQEKRRIDEMAAESTPGGGLAQFAGEVAPSLLIPGGSGARVLNRALAAARGPGYMTVPTAAQAAGRLSMPMAMGGAALESGAASAFMPTTSDESRAGNIAAGFGFGAGAPVLAKTLGGGARAAGRAIDPYLAAVPGRIGANAAIRAAERDTAQGLANQGVQMTPSRYAAQDYVPNTSAAGPRSAALGDFQPTTAAAYSGAPGQPGTAAPGLAQAEKAARGLDPSAWEARDALEAQKRWTQLDESLRGQGDIDRALNRADQTPPPYQTVSPQKFDKRLYQFQQRLEDMTESPAYVGNPAARAAVDELRRAIATGNVNPQALHELRKSLAKGLTGTPGLGEAGVRAASSDPTIMRLVQHIDAVMSASAYAGKGSKWADWRQAYSGILREAEGAKAEEGLRRSFVTDAGVPKRGTADTPQLGAGFAGAAEKFMVPTRGRQAGQNQFTPQAQQAVSDIVRDLNAQGIVDRVRKAATLGGSDTAYNLTTQAMGGVLLDMIFSGGFATAGVLTKARASHQILQAKRELQTRIMQDPAQFRAFIDAAARRAREMAQSEGTSASTLARFGGAGAAASQLADSDEPR